MGFKINYYEKKTKYKLLIQKRFAYFYLNKKFKKQKQVNIIYYFYFVGRYSLFSDRNTSGSTSSCVNVERVSVTTDLPLLNTLSPERAEHIGSIDQKN